MATRRPTRTPRHRARVAAALGSVALASFAAGCSSGYQALGTHTARVLVNGTEVGERPPVRCEQVGLMWHIESLQPSPGFTAQVHIRDPLEARLVRLDNIGGFTGSAWKDTDSGARVETDAAFADGTFTITGTALGYYAADPGETATADFEIRTDC